MGVSARSSRSEAFSQLIGLDFDVMQRAPRGFAGLIHRAIAKEAFVFHFSSTSSPFGTVRTP
jgi:hypothetical protein